MVADVFRLSRCVNVLRCRPNFEYKVFRAVSPLSLEIFRLACNSQKPVRFIFLEPPLGLLHFGRLSVKQLSTECRIMGRKRPPKIPRPFPNPNQLYLAIANRNLSSLSSSKRTVISSRKYSTVSISSLKYRLSYYPTRISNLIF